MSSTFLFTRTVSLNRILISAKTVYKKEQAVSEITKMSFLAVVTSEHGYIYVLLQLLFFHNMTV